MSNNNFNKNLLGLQDIIINNIEKKADVINIRIKLEVKEHQCRVVATKQGVSTIIVNKKLKIFLFEKKIQINTPKTQIHMQKLWQENFRKECLSAPLLSINKPETKLKEG